MEPECVHANVVMGGGFHCIDYQFSLFSTNFGAKTLRDWQCRVDYDFGACVDAGIECGVAGGNADVAEDARRWADFVGIGGVSFAVAMVTTPIMKKAFRYKNLPKRFLF